jgi:hypothetical protein
MPLRSEGCMFIPLQKLYCLQSVKTQPEKHAPLHDHLPIPHLLYMHDWFETCLHSGRKRYLSCDIGPATFGHPDCPSIAMTAVCNWDLQAQCSTQTLVPGAVTNHRMQSLSHVQVAAIAYHTLQRSTQEYDGAANIHRQPRVL